MSFFEVRFTVFVFALAPLFAYAGGDEVVVIYNTRLAGSKVVAEHYAQMRQVPETQIYGFDLPITEEMTRAEFRDALQFPLASRLVVDNLWRFGSVTNAATNGQPQRVNHPVVESKIRYAVLCWGVPLKIAADPNLREPGRENVRPELLRNEAAVDSELAWLPLLKMNVPLSGPLPNWVYGTTNLALLHPTNGILLVARLDGPSVEIARASGGQGTRRRTRRLVGPRLLRRPRTVPNRHQLHQLYFGRRMDPGCGRNLPPTGF